MRALPLTEAAFAATGTFCARRIQNSERAFQRSWGRCRHTRDNTSEEQKQ